MITIRCNTFETNSSSSHSLVIREENTFHDYENFCYTKEEIIDELDWLLSEDKKVYGKSWCDWYYGRFPFKILTTFRDKLSYAYACFHNDENKVNELINVVKEYIPTLERFCDVQDVGTDDSCLQSWLNTYNISLRDYLINRKYIVICDGDEYNIWASMVNCGVVDLDCIENASAQPNEREE